MVVQWLTSTVVDKKYFLSQKLPYISAFPSILVLIMSENLLEKIAKIDQQVADDLRGKSSITNISLVICSLHSL